MSLLRMRLRREGRAGVFMGARVLCPAAPVKI
jgi:hypothetical protein